MNSLKKAYLVGRNLGPAFVATRLGLLLDKKLGKTRRRFASRSWDEIDRCLGQVPTSGNEYFHWKRQQGTAFFFPLGRPPLITHWSAADFQLRTPSLAQRVQLLRDERLTYFLERPSPTPVDWYCNPFDGGTGDAGRPWFEIPDFVPQQGDARMLWEPSRAAWAIDLARAFAIQLYRQHDTTQAEPSHAEIFWRLVESWMDACPPWRGFQWKCGQEASVRFLAIAMGCWAFANDSATTPGRWKKFARLAWATGYRVFHHIRYAVSQKNNHALSEACGLMLVAHLFPEFPESEIWGSKGRAVLVKELPRQILDDGSYVQHSMNYHRVMLHVCLVAFRLAELAGKPMERSLYERLGNAGEFLQAMIDPVSGEVPRYGHNDGACVLPLNECRYWDFRPVVAATHYLVHRQPLYEPGPWNEDLTWLFGERAELAESMRAESDHTNPDSVQRDALSPGAKSRRFDSGGYYTLRASDSWAMIRCHTYRNRPGQCDPLHLDLWWRGVNILRDCGTYQYYVPNRSALEAYFGSLAAHNTLQIDRSEPFERVTRFLWFPWPRARVTRISGDVGGRLLFEGERFDYDRRPWNVVHRRTVTSWTKDAWVVVDDLCGSGHHSGVLRWHFPDVPCTIDAANQSVELNTPAGLVSVAVQVHRPKPIRFELVRGREQPDDVQGMAADQYGQIVKIPTLEVEASGVLPIRIVTMLGLGKRIMPDDAKRAAIDEIIPRQAYVL